MNSLLYIAPSALCVATERVGRSLWGGGCGAVTYSCLSWRISDGTADESDVVDVLRGPGRSRYSGMSTEESRKASDSDGPGQGPFATLGE